MILIIGFVGDGSYVEAYDFEPKTMMLWTPRKLCLSLLIALTFLTQACQNNERPESEAASSEIEPSSLRREENLRETEEPKSREVSPQVITKEVVVVANPLASVPAKLNSKYADSKINIRAKPTIQSQAKHFGYKGDRIALLKEAQTDRNETWYFVEFDQSKAKGWVRGDFVSVLEQPEEADDVIPVDYSGTYVYKSPQTGVITASLSFRQTDKVIQFTAVQQNPSCPPEIDGEAVFTPEDNRFIGNTNDGQFQLTFIPIFLNGQHTGQFDIVTADAKTQERLTESFEACTYDGIYQQK